ncbi:MAG: hypothetical protein IKA13_03245 [Bacteroidales bacterium]|nr:hypothetical protein [Bacteroidales bacterium]
MRRQTPHRHPKGTPTLTTVSQSHHYETPHATQTPRRHIHSHNGQMKTPL